MSAYASDTYYYVSHDGSDPVPEIERPRVLDVMYVDPKTLPRDARVSDVRDLFARSRIKVALLVDGNVCVGTLGRDDIPHDAGPDEDAARYAHQPVTILRDAPLAEAHRSISPTVDGRLVVVDGDGALQGLLCHNTARTGFCTRRLPTDEPAGRKRTLWEVIRTAGDERCGTLVAPNGTSFKLGDRLNLPSQDGTTSWLVVALEPGTGDEGTLVLDPFDG